MRTVGSAESGAIFSEDMKYRYRLWRCWNPGLPRALFILLNPSTADEVHNDPTVERQCRRVIAWSERDLLPTAKRKLKNGFGAIEVVNACALRSTNPAALYEVDDPVGDDNGAQIHNAIAETMESRGLIVCGWGSHLSALRCGKSSLHDVFFKSIDCYPLTALKLNQDGTPQHPLYLSYDLKPRAWIAGELREEVL
jgi:hypothetical protein